MSSVTPYSFYLLISEFVVRLIQRVKVDAKKTDDSRAACCGGSVVFSVGIAALLP